LAASRRQIDDGNAQGHVSIDRLCGGILINCILRACKIGGPPLMSAQIIRKNIRAKCAGCINAAARR
jgi:hypothetical protein